MTVNQLIAYSQILLLIVIIVRVVFYKKAEGLSKNRFISIMAYVIAASSVFWLGSLFQASRFHVNVGQLGMLLAVTVLLCTCNGSVGKAFNREKLEQAIKEKFRGKKKI